MWNDILLLKQMQGMKWRVSWAEENETTATFLDSLQWRHNGHDGVWPAFRLFTQVFVQAQIKENIKAPRHYPLWGEFTGDEWIPRRKGQ